MVSKLFTAPISWFYGLAVTMRHKFFDWGFLPSEEFDIPIVCVGNLTVGGTGKTPHTEFLVGLLSPYYNVAVVSRGYKRKTKGFVLATINSSCKQIGDEPKQIKLKYPNIPLAVCEKRAEGIRRLRELHPEVNLVILDDAFQHRYVESWVNIILMDYTKPIYKDRLIPLGRLRDTKKQLARANFVITTKCPDNIKPIDTRVVFKSLELYPYQSLFFTKIISEAPVPLFPEYRQRVPYKGQDVVVMAGIANPDPFIEETEKKFNIVDFLIYPDHYAYKTRDLQYMKEALAKGSGDAIILTTEKDAVKLFNSKKIPDDLRKKLYFVPVHVAFVDLIEHNSKEEFLKKLLPYVKKNHKYHLLNKE